MGMRVMNRIRRRLSRSPFARAILGVDRHRSVPFFRTSTDAKWGTFRSESGVHYPLYDTLRERVKNGRIPGLCKPSEGRLSRGAALPHPAQSRDFLDVECLIAAYGRRFENAHVLEFGCGTGSRRQLYVDANARSIVMADIGSDGDECALLGREIPVCESSKMSFVELAKVREVEGQIVDDICASKLPDDAFDIVLSWEVLEHVDRPDLALAEVARVLKPGGVFFSQYNPFYSATGGHWRCTLDFMWGHCLLSEDDFERYIALHRSDEYDLAMAFYSGALNRLSLVQCEAFMRQASFVDSAVLPWPERSVLRNFDHFGRTLWNESNADVGLMDLVSNSVWVVGRKAEL